MQLACDFFVNVLRTLERKRWRALLVSRRCRLCFLYSTRAQNLNIASASKFGAKLCRIANRNSSQRCVAKQARGHALNIFRPERIDGAWQISMDAAA
ncbi:MAG: hypothetical protein WKF30_19235 [Pyrinomonadaceae bacterium]